MPPFLPPLQTIYTLPTTFTHHHHLPTVHAATGANTFAIYGRGEEKELTELVPGILSQLGPEAMNGLRKIAESYQAQQGSAGSLGPDGVPAVAAEDDDDDEVPELVEADAVSVPLFRGDVPRPRNSANSIRPCPFLSHPYVHRPPRLTRLYVASRRSSTYPLSIQRANSSSLNRTKARHFLLLPPSSFSLFGIVALAKCRN